MSGPEHLLVLDPDGTGGGLDAVLRMPGVEQAHTLGAALERIEQLRVAGSGARFAVIGPAEPHPLSAARALRTQDPTIGLALVVGGDLESMDARLAFVPELSGATVISATASSERIAATVRDARSSGSLRFRVRAALDAMNQELARTTAPSPSEGSRRQEVSESYLAALTRHAPDAIVSVDAQFCVVAVNDAACRLFDVTADDAEGHAIEEVFGPAAGPRLRRLATAALAGDRGRRDDLVFRDPAGREIVATATAAPVRDRHGGVLGVVLLARDVTDERRAEERLRQLQKAESLATLAGGVAHDFNNLLVSVRGWADLALDDVADTEFVTTALENVRTAAGRAADLARSMLAYSGGGRLELEAVDVAGVVRDLVQLLRASVQRSVTLEVELADDLPAVEADATQLGQVVMNLVTNAGEALGQAGGRIRVSAREVRLPDPAARAAPTAGEQPAPGRYVAVEVSDDGPGMSAEVLGRVFDPFFTTKFPGRGLGLAASHGIAQALGGALTVRSRPGEGATFRLLLPMDGGRNG